MFDLTANPKIMRIIVNKIILIAVKDSQDGIRLKVLQQLGANWKLFRKFLIPTENVRKLLICLYDQNF